MYAYVTRFGSPEITLIIIINIAFSKITNTYQRLKIAVTSSML